MSDKSRRHPAVPYFDDPFLDRIAAAISARARALKHQTAEFACTREIEELGDERFNVDLRTSGPHPTQVRLSVWADCGMWLGVHKSNPRRQGGWAFAYSGHGEVPNTDPADLVRRFEETLLLAHTASTRAETADELDELWAAARLERER